MSTNESGERKGGKGVKYRLYKTETHLEWLNASPFNRGLNNFLVALPYIFILLGSLIFIIFEVKYGSVTDNYKFITYDSRKYTIEEYFKESAKDMQKFADNYNSKLFIRGVGVTLLFSSMCLTYDKLFHFAMIPYVNWVKQNKINIEERIDYRYIKNNIDINKKFNLLGYDIYIAYSKDNPSFLKKIYIEKVICITISLITCIIFGVYVSSVGQLTVWYNKTSAGFSHDFSTKEFVSNCIIILAVDLFSTIIDIIITSMYNKQIKNWVKAKLDAID